MPVTKRIHLTTSGGQNMDGEYDCSSACGLNEDSNAEWNGTRTRELVTCKRCLTKMAKPKIIRPIGYRAERPILFSGPMVRAILEGRKTVTRRALKGRHLPRLSSSPFPGAEWTATAQHHPRYGFNVSGATEAECAAELAMYGACPHGRRGDRLWVREAWARVGIAQAPDQQWVVYRESDNRTDYGGPWKPSIHMPRWASRILLEITAVRVERLQDISEAQALAEGIYSDPAVNGMYTADGDNYTSKQDGPGRAFADLWKSTGGDWVANPWVWVVEFKRVTP